MRPATRPLAHGERTRMMVLDAAQGSIEHAEVSALRERLRAGDVLVVNDSATLPAALPARILGLPGELRLASGSSDPMRWQAVLFGAGDWRTRTEDRAPPPSVPVGAVIDAGPRLRATVEAVSPLSPRLVTLRFEGHPEALLRELYAHGRPVQYAHLEGELPLWQAQTAYAGRPWSVEAPSAGFPLTWSLLDGLRGAGVTVCAITHGAGLSSTGDPAIDRSLPLPERCEIAPPTCEAIARARSSGHRVIAVGTSVVRALEGCAFEHGALKPWVGETSLRLDARSRPRVVDGVISGMHEPDTSHFALLSAFAPPSLLHAGLIEAEREGYLAHEFGDLSLVLAA